MNTRQADLIVIGSGPAGISAATVAARRGLSVLVLDEHPRPGGRLLGQLHQQPGQGGDGWWRGARIAAQMIAEAEAAGVEILTGAAVWALRPRWEVMVQGAPFAAARAPRVLIATGAAEKSVPVPGWTLPGTMTAGAAQVFVNVHRVRPGRRALVVGVNVLTLTIARELALAGVEVAGIVLPPLGAAGQGSASPTAVIADLGRMARLAPSPLLRLGGGMARGGLAALAAALYPRSGLRLWGFPLLLRHALAEIVGQTQVTGAVLEQVTPGGTPTGRYQQLELDLVCISDGLYPLAELAMAAGCRMIQVPELGGAVPLYGPEMQTTAPGIFVAGSITGIEGAQVAAAQGRVAGYGIAAAAGRIPPDDPGPAAARRELAETRRRSPISFHSRLGEGLQQVARAWGAHARSGA